MGVVSELKRRNVLRMAVLYIVVAWAIVQVADVLIGLASLPASLGQVVLGLLALGFPIALIFSWFFEITPEGLVLEKDVPEGQSITHVTGRRMDFIIIAILQQILAARAMLAVSGAAPGEGAVNRRACSASRMASTIAGMPSTAMPPPGRAASWGLWRKSGVPSGKA